jgi:hypothetical protein
VDDIVQRLDTLEEQIEHAGELACPRNCTAQRSMP